jgi:prepilin-type N-terminal cleavage/methylation domain-containing protein
MRRRAFTLVELLVVIGIVALLISILLPSLNKARDAAKRTVCLSNLRELGNSIRLYATAFKDSIPIGYMAEKQFSYVALWHDGGTGPLSFKPSQMGLLVLANVAPAPKVFYCPSEDDPQFVFNSGNGGNAVNAWPYYQHPPRPLVIGAGRNHCRLGYNARPIADWPTNSFVTNPADYRFWTPMMEPKPASTADWLTKGTFAMPRLSRLKNKAILADLIMYKPAVIRRHKTGVNVLYANGSAQWVLLKAFDKANWKNIPDQSFSTSWNTTMLNTLANGTETGVWTDLDKQSR